MIKIVHLCTELNSYSRFYKMLNTLNMLNTHFKREEDYIIYVYIIDN